MRETMIVYAHPNTFQLLAENPRRFSGTRKGILERAYAAWLVFCGRADALCWEEWERQQMRLNQQKAEPKE